KLLGPRMLQRGRRDLFTASVPHFDAAEAQFDRLGKGQAHRRGRGTHSRPDAGLGVIEQRVRPGGGWAAKAHPTQDPQDASYPVSFHQNGCHLDAGKMSSMNRSMIPTTPQSSSSWARPLRGNRPATPISIYRSMYTMPGVVEITDFPSSSPWMPSSKLNSTTPT